MIKFTYEDAIKYRNLMNLAAESLEDNDALTVPYLFKNWTPGIQYEINSRVQYQGILYKVLQSHTSQSDWTPDIASSLYARVLIPDPTIIPEWEQPSSTNPYMLGDKVRHNGFIWVSIIDNNVWEPGIYGWEQES